jgi:hypothetical protein
MARITDPICNHTRYGIVTTHPPGTMPNGAHAATSVCNRDECIEDAKFWVRTKTGKEAHHIVDGAR